MADFLSKITKYLIPEEDVETTVTASSQENVKVQNKNAASVSAAPIQQVNGPTIYPTVDDSQVQSEDVAQNSRPNLKVYKQANMNILVFEPASFNDTKAAADSLKNRKTVLMNYEKIEYSEQVRICDFMNGACYVLDGSVKRISANMVLYVPNGVSIESITSNKD